MSFLGVRGGNFALVFGVGIWGIEPPSTPWLPRENAGKGRNRRWTRMNADEMQAKHPSFFYLRLSAFICGSLVFSLASLAVQMVCNLISLDPIGGGGVEQGQMKPSF